MNPLHWSDLRHMNDSPAHYQHALKYGVEVTPAMRFGSLVHSLVLGRTRGFVVFEGKRGNNKIWQQFKLDHAGLEIVTTDEWARASDCADAVKADPVCGHLLKSGVKEKLLTWKVGDRECAGTPDLNGGLLVDLKVTPLASPRRFERQCRAMLWHAQAVWYLDGIERQPDAEPVADVYLVAVPPKPPHLPVAYHFSERTIELGRKTWMQLFTDLMLCEVGDTWRGYADAPITLDMEEWGDLELVIGGEEVTI